MTSARTGTAPCGHPGTYVTPTFVTCDQRCGFSDGVPEPVEDRRTKPLCKSCGSDDLERYLPHAFLDVYQCRDCKALTY